VPATVTATLEGNDSIRITNVGVVSSGGTTGDGAFVSVIGGANFADEFLLGDSRAEVTGGDDRVRSRASPTPRPSCTSRRRGRFTSRVGRGSRSRPRITWT
jgi:hypothetical protein